MTVKPSQPDTFLPGRTHERLQQFHRGVPVVGAEVTRQLDGGVTVSLSGTVHRGIGLDAVPALSAQEAGRIAGRTAGGRILAGQSPELVVLPLDDGRYELAWKAEVRSAADVRACFIGASSGRALLDYSTLKPQQPGSRPAPARVEAVSAGGDAALTAAVIVAGEWRTPPRARTEDGSAGPARDAAVMAARSAIDATRGYYLQRTGRFALDDSPAPVLVVVHPASAADWGRAGSPYGRYFAGAFWDGRTITLGEGTPDGASVDGRSWANAAFSSDLVAHELAHAVLDRTAGLIYRRESGALAEAYADIIASSVAAASASDEERGDRDPYVIGEAATAGGERSLSHPAQHGHPDHYSGVDMEADVHANSTVASHAFYLAIEGGVNRTSGLAVEGVGAAARHQVERAFARAFAYMLPAAATFAAAREATIQSARDLSGPGSEAVRAIGEAWAAVGVR